MSKAPIYRRALGTLRQSFWQVGLYSAGANLLMLVGPLYMLQIYDRVMSSGSVPTLMGLFCLVIVLYGFMALYDMMRGRILSRAAYRFDAELGRAAFDQRLASTGAANPLRDLEILRSFLSGPAMRGLFDAPWLPIFLVAVFLFHPVLGWLTLAGAVVVVGLALLNHHFSQEPLARAAEGDGQERAFLEQCRRGADTVAALGMRQALAQRWQGMHDTALAQAQIGGERGDIFASISKAFRLLLQSTLLTGGAFLALQQEISIGMIVGVSILAGRALAPIDQVIGQWRSIVRARTAHRDLAAALAGVAPAEAKTSEDSLLEVDGALRLEGVTKLAPGAGVKKRPILDSVSFALEPGDGLCVIGNSASGKSSLARMLVGAWAPDRGQVRLGGATLEQWTPDALGREIGYLPQQIELFPGNIAENIARFDPGAAGEAVFEAASLARVHEMILSLPEGYKTQVGHGQQVLSGGQIQRIGLARALYRVPKFVVLDEPNAHLDAQGDAALVQTIQELRARGTTVVMMTHRAGLVAAANKALVMAEGRVAQFGPVDQVMQELHPQRGAAPGAQPRPGPTDAARRPPALSAVPTQPGLKSSPARMPAAKTAKKTAQRLAAAKVKTAAKAKLTGAVPVVESVPAEPERQSA